MNQNEIKRIRQLYLTTGSLKRDELRAEIVYSWVRSRLFGITGEEELVPIFQKEAVSACVRLLLKKIESDKFQQEITPFYCNAKGKVLYYLSKKPLCYTFSEEVIGTNGIALAMHTGKASYVAGYEHYHEELRMNTTIGIPYKDNGYLAYVVNGVLSESEVSALVEHTKRVGLQLEDKQGDVEQERFADHKFDAMEAEADHTPQIEEWAPIEVLIGSRKLARRQLKAYGLNDVLEIDGETFPWKARPVVDALKNTLQEILADHENVLLCSNIEHFPVEELEYILKQTHCKPVNFNRFKPSKRSACRVFLSNESKAFESGSVLTDLQYIITLLQDEEGRISENGNPVNSDVSQNRTRRMSMYRMVQGEVKGRTLKETEQYLIEETIEACNGNMKKAAELLGISRSTLYRKIEKFENQSG